MPLPSPGLLPAPWLLPGNYGSGDDTEPIPASGPLAHLLTLPVTLTLVTESATVNDYGDPVPTETTVDTYCELQQRRRDEPGDQGEFSRTDWRLYLPPTVSVDTAAKATVDGTVYEFVGDPWYARNPRTGVVSHVECDVRRAA